MGATATQGGRVVDNFLFSSFLVFFFLAAATLVKSAHPFFLFFPQPFTQSQKTDEPRRTDKQTVALPKPMERKQHWQGGDMRSPGSTAERHLATVVERRDVTLFERMFDVY
eukprot:TRINITY_DN2536_c1_g1_i2.p1 TRINITY_DN2536_c1_g1~~TRINITY_DN2536_c1_g1_i2.p1  ORF type:complete len:111 (+),score=1.65 TRINITY_DN2536_c1_g1_i2:35-367(+)